MLVLDILLTILHVLVICFNLIGWIWKKTRKLHRWVVLATALSWIGLGPWKGWGYCFLTDWHWEVKENRGITGLPNSFIKYAVDAISGMDVDASVVDIMTAVTFAVIVCITIFFLVHDQRKNRQSTQLPR
jgi:hypothetical protein